jgi:hypothetical protein
MLYSFFSFFFLRRRLFLEKLSLIYGLERQQQLNIQIQIFFSTRVSFDVLASLHAR